MPKKISQSEFDAIIELISRYPEGVSIEKIINSLNITHRNVHHRLRLLVQKGNIIGEGKTRSRTYRLVPIENQALQIHKEIQKETLIPLTSTSEEIQKLICQPVQKRKPVGYNRDFLDDYYPNKTNYLTEEICKKLFELGKTDGDRPAGTYARQVFDRLLIDLSWNSSRLEGNTYSLLETERLIELSAYVEGKDIQEAQMILNHKAAIEFLVDSADEIGINKFTILNLHALLSQNLLADPKAGGRIRTKSVGITGSTYHPLVVPAMINECFQKIVETANAIKDPFEQAFFLMVHLPYLQPFEDVNKRVSRLSANIPLIQLNLCPLSFVDLPKETYLNGLLAVYELNRIELLRDIFIWSYERSCAFYSATRKALGEPDPFRLRYRSLIYDTINSVIKECMNKTQAVNAIKHASESLPSNDQSKFIETVENELRGMHEGNIARYRLRPSEYEIWNKTWT